MSSPNSPAVSNASTYLPYPAPTSATMPNSYPAQMSYSASPQPSIDESIAHIQYIPTIHVKTPPNCDENVAVIESYNTYNDAKSYPNSRHS